MLAAFVLMLLVPPIVRLAYGRADNGEREEFELCPAGGECSSLMSTIAKPRPAPIER